MCFSMTSVPILFKRVSFIAYTYTDIIRIENSNRLVCSNCMGSIMTVSMYKCHISHAIIIFMFLCRFDGINLNEYHKS